MMFNERKTTQMAVYLLQLAGGTINKMKLLKLLYLSERESLRRYGMPMTGDKIVAMEYGPVLSTTYDLTKLKASDAADNVWHASIARKNQYTLRLKQTKKLRVSDFDELSKADIEILKYTWKEFEDLGRMAD